MLNKKQEEEQAQPPKHLLSKDKKTNEAIFKHHYKQKIAHQRNKLVDLLHNFQPGFMMPQYEGDQTLKTNQQQIKQAVNIQTASNMFDLELNMGSYECHYSNNGKTAMLSSDKGHLSLLDWRQKQLLLEINLKEKILDGCFLHNDEMFALAQPNNTFIYDNRGIQLHKIDRSLGLEYLPYHFLLVGYDNRKLRYYDTSTGFLVADHVAKNRYTTMKQNKTNGVIALGTEKGVVEWWTPGIGSAQVKIFVGGRVDGIAFHKGYMTTISDKVKIWDSRMLKVVEQYPIQKRLNGVQVSDSGLTCLNYGHRLQIFKDYHLSHQTHPYMKYSSNSHIVNGKFVPFEDLMGLGTSKGFNCIAVPGAGTPFYDTFEVNPFETKKQKRQSLVHHLLEKLPSETITIDENILGGISRISKAELDKEAKQEHQKQQKQRIQKLLLKRKAKGKSKLKNKLNRKTIEVQKLKRAELTKVINTKLWARRAELKKKDSEMKLIEDMEQKGIGVSELMSISKKKKISKQ